VPEISVFLVNLAEERKRLRARLYITGQPEYKIGVYLENLVRIE
jgi:hypothetical protein